MDITKKIEDKLNERVSPNSSKLTKLNNNVTKSINTYEKFVNTMDMYPDQKRDLNKKLGIVYDAWMDVMNTSIDLDI